MGKLCHSTYYPGCSRGPNNSKYFGVKITLGKPIYFRPVIGAIINPLITIVGAHLAYFTESFVGHFIVTYIGGLEHLGKCANYGFMGNLWLIPLHKFLSVFTPKYFGSCWPPRN